MYKPIYIRVGRHNTVAVRFDGDISTEVLTSEIRKEKSKTSELIATFTPSFATDGTDGILLLTLDQTASDGITFTNGWMDIKKIEDGKSTSAFQHPVPVIFEGVVTA